MPKLLALFLFFALAAADTPNATDASAADFGETSTGFNRITTSFFYAIGTLVVCALLSFADRVYPTTHVRSRCFKANELEGAALIHPRSRYCRIASGKAVATAATPSIVTTPAPKAPQAPRAERSTRSQPADRPAASIDSWLNTPARPAPSRQEMLPTNAPRRAVTEDYDLL